MPLYQPTNITPSTLSGVGGGTVDATDPLTVFWQVNGSSALTGYQIQIFENTAASRLVYNSGNTPVSPPFFGTTNTGQTQFYEVTIPNSALSGLQNGFASGYKMLITQSWSGGSIEQLSPSFFWTRAKPTLSLAPFANPVTSRMAEFTAHYAQAQGDPLDWFRWMLAVQGDEENPIADSGEIYGTEDIRVSYDGLFVGTAYVVRCIIQTAYGIQADTGWQPFHVQYGVSDFIGYVEACPGRLDGVLVRWSRVSYIPGQASGNHTLQDGVLHLPSGSTITWDEKNGAPMDFQTPWSIAWSSYYPPDGTSPAVTINDNVAVQVTPAAVRILKDGALVGEVEIDGIVSETPIRIVITPRELHVYSATYDFGLFPDHALYPSDALFPYGGTMIWRVRKVPLTWVQPDITSITLHGQQQCEWITVIDGEVSGSMLHSLLTDLQFEPEWTVDTLFLATFTPSTGINAGNITPPDNEDIVGVALYRQGAGDARLSLVANVEISSNEIIDMGYRNQEQYTYYVFALGETRYVSAALPSNPIVPMHWNWTLMDCEQDANGIYHVRAAHIFRNSVSTDAITNNNTPNLLQNFTPYPTRQPSSYNYRSSTLTGYIGQVDMVNNRYADTVDQANALWDLSVSTGPKFLRDRKGNFWRVETHAAITMQTGDNQAPQPYFGSVPWLESGDTDGVSVVCEAGDGAWNDLMPPLGQTGQTQIVVTAPYNTQITITNGDITYTTTYDGVLRYTPPVSGEWTISGALENAHGSKTITIQEGETYYVGLVLQTVYAYLAINAPSGTLVTVSMGEYSETKQVP